MVAVQRYGLAIRDIKNPSEAVQMAAVQQVGWAIEYIDNPSEAVQMAAVQQNGHAIQFIKNPSEAVRRARRGTTQRGMKKNSRQPKKVIYCYPYGHPPRDNRRTSPRY
jgi:hypothetical protein